MAVVGVIAQEERGEDIDVALEMLQTATVVFTCGVGVLHTKTRAEVPFVGEGLLQVGIQSVDMFVEGDPVVALTHGALRIVVASVGGAGPRPLSPKAQRPLTKRLGIV